MWKYEFVDSGNMDGYVVRFYTGESDFLIRLSVERSEAEADAEIIARRLRAAEARRPPMPNFGEGLFGAASRPTPESVFGHTSKEFASRISESPADEPGIATEPVPTCETCRFWLNEHNLPECRRYPAQLDQEEGSCWPRVEAGDWCGEHEPKDKADTRKDEIDRIANIIQSETAFYNGLSVDVISEWEACVKAAKRIVAIEHEPSAKKTCEDCSRDAECRINDGVDHDLCFEHFLRRRETTKAGK